MKNQLTILVIILFVLSITVIPMQLFAGKITVENYSFELPGTQKYKNFEEVPGWSTDTICTDSGVEQDPNAPATDGGWTAFQRSSDPAMWQLTEHTLEAGEVLYLMVDGKITWAANRWAIVLYYDDAGARVVAAADTVDITDNWTKYTIKLVADEVPEAIGKKIGILFDNVSAGDNWIGLDNVRLSSGNDLLAIDAEKDAFYETLTGPDDGYVQIRFFAHHESGMPDNDADYSAKVWTAWDEDWFYLYQEVKDDVISANHGDVWNTDCLEIKIDPEPTDSVTNSVWDTRMTALGPDDAPAGQPTDNLNNVADSLKQFARKLTDDGYVLELAVKWDVITSNNETIAAAVDNIFGMGIMNHDNDSDHRSASIIWAAEMRDAIWNTPKYHGTIKFLDENKLQFIPTNNMTGVTNTTPYDGSLPPLVIDAEKDAFYGTLTGPDDGYLQIRWFAHNNNGKPDNDADLSAKLWTSWDETYLYLYEEVKDNVVNLNNATSWQDDVLEVYIDPDPTADITTAQLGFHITALDSADADPAALAGVINLQGYNCETGATTEDYARKRTDDGYVLECRVKWEVLQDATRAITPAAGNSFGMATMNHDNDVSQREGSVAWSAVLNDNVWNTPANHGTVTFLEDNKLQFVATSTRSGAVNTLPYDGSLPAIVIDAEKDAFYETLTGPDDGYLYIPHQQYNTNGAPDNDLDLSARLWTRWDETYLYLYEEVKDNVVNLNNATSWQDDVLEVYIDPDPSADITTAQLGFHITALDSADADPAALAGVINLRGYNIETGATTEDYARKRTDDGFVLECRVAWDSLKDATRAITPAVGNIFGMATMNHDNDVAQREGSVAWSAVLNDNVWNTPANHGTVTFLEDNKLQFDPTSTRSGEVVPHPEWYDPEMPFMIAMDAVMDPWYNQLTGPDDGYIYLPARAYNTNGAPDNNKDLSALLWVAWDDTYLYLYEEVADDVVNLNNATSWQDDVLEVYIDPDPSADITTAQLGFHITALDSADADPAALAGVINLRGYNLETGATTEDYARARTDNGYVLECRVKWELLQDATRSINPAEGTIFGMATMNHDNDVAQREASVSFATVMNDNVWNTPDNHGTVEFLADHKLKLTAMSTRTGVVNDSADVWYNPAGIIKVEVIEKAKEVVPSQFTLAQNYPNPFNPTTTIMYDLPSDVKVNLTIFDILGREVATLVDEKQQAGSYSVTFEAMGLPSGMYFYRLEAGDHIFTKKMTMVK